MRQPRHALSEEGADVVVVGGGLSGLVATTALHAAGAKVTCLEARERVGGRTLSTDGWIDLGATWFWDGETAVAETVATLGLATYPQHLGGDALFERPEGPPTRLVGNPIDVPASRVDGGMQSLSIELARRLPVGVVRTGLPVSSVTVDEQSVQVAAGEGTIEARAVVLAVPPKLAVESIRFAPALPPRLGQAAAAVHTWMGDTVKAVARFEEPFWRRSGLAGAALSHAGPFTELHDHSGREPQHAAIFGFARAAQFEGEQRHAVAERFVAQLVRLWGRAAGRPTALHIADWSQEPYTATPGAAPSSPSWFYNDPVLRAPHVGGRLTFASTETAHAFAGHLEGAVLAGRRAASQVLALLDGHGERPLPS